MYYCQEVRLITDTSEQQRIVKACHCDPTSGHLGVKRTIMRVRERFAWKGINKEVAELVCCYIATYIYTYT